MHKEDILLVNMSQEVKFRVQRNKASATRRGRLFLFASSVHVDDRTPVRVDLDQALLGSQYPAASCEFNTVRY